VRQNCARWKIQLLGKAIKKLMLSARNQGVDPQAYLRDVIERLPQLKINDPALKELLPSE